MQRDKIHVGEESLQTKANTGMDPTENELIGALRQAQDLGGNTNGYATTAELANALGWRHLKIREGLLELKGKGLLEVAQDWRENLAGRRTRVPVYRLRV